uniref:Defective in cullin neddylation protein n=1 Tax=Hanusia phi TaxID=3032 RepID=A0A7S0EME9_9CRYP
MPLKDLFTRKKASPAKESDKEAASPMFDKYHDPEDDKIGPDGVMALCNDMQMEPTDVRLLVLAWQMRAESQGYFSRGEWQHGIMMMGFDSVSSLVSCLTKLRDELFRSPRSQAFKDFYRFAFRYSRTPGQKSLEIDTVKLLLPMVFPPSHPHVAKLLVFLEQTPAVRGLNEDQWVSFLLFSNEIQEDFANFDPNDAWPSLLDDFVAHNQQ